MAIIRTINIDRQTVLFKASAAIPRLYRQKYRRDIFADMSALMAAISASDEGASTLTAFNLETFENIAYIMAKYADPRIPDSTEVWLDRFNTFSIYQILPELLVLWGFNVEALETAKKNSVQQSES